MIATKSIVQYLPVLCIRTHLLLYPIDTTVSSTKGKTRFSLSYYSYSEAYGTWGEDPVVIRTKAVSPNRSDVEKYGT
jgi:hypothetical protein